MDKGWVIRVWMEDGCPELYDGAGMTRDPDGRVRIFDDEKQARSFASLMGLYRDRGLKIEVVGAEGAIQDLRTPRKARKR